MKLLYFVFSLFLIVFLIIEFRSFLQISIPDWLLFYGKDFLCMPIVLTICLTAVRFLKKDQSINLTLFTVLSLCTFYSIYFEAYLPKVHSRYTADLLDVIMYFSGGFLFYFLQRKKANREMA